MTEFEEYRGPPSTLGYSDLLIVTLTKHEKHLSTLVERLEKVLDQLESLDEKTTPQKRKRRKSKL